MDKGNFLFVVLFCLAVSDLYYSHPSGTLDNDHKIIGGVNATIEDYPYIVYLRLKEAITGEYYQCGGSIVTTRCVLTAAHCISGAESVSIRVGSTYSMSGGYTYDPTTMIKHPRYNGADGDHDIAVIKLKKPIIPTKRSKKVTLPTEKCTVPVGTNLTVAGWGHTKEKGSVSEKLMAVSVLAVPYDVCNKTYSDLTTRMICAGVLEGGRDSCQGDSGGPLVLTGTRQQVGVVSFGNGCARPDTPGVYTNLCDPDIQKWIKEMGCA